MMNLKKIWKESRERKDDDDENEAEQDDEELAGELDEELGEYNSVNTGGNVNSAKAEFHPCLKAGALASNNILSKPPLGEELDKGSNPEIVGEAATASPALRSDPDLHRDPPPGKPDSSPAEHNEEEDVEQEVD